ncbi:3'-5' exonuclease [Streptococcus saliviloxodontae]|uniref:DNA polymerase-3 subunit epsilon n=1 Tax=Streptococcus saliviloxodontae TaxID=1349416 RepID=A0ABS2PKD7_9STRE|nr:3'-5' exonuclease [Streptococcus saliviloxodontae]MBM7635278.1 DNA polymerase-3 subunit epsilon [Streptococcus saliviloxodontae]
MERLQDYVAFDLEFNTVEDKSHIIQVSAVKMSQHRELEQFDSYVYSEVPLKSFINGLTGITSEKLANAPLLEEVLTAFKDFIGNSKLVGYNAVKSDLPLLLENGLDLTEQYAVDLYDEAFERRSSDLNGIVNLKLTTVADFLEIKGKGHDSLEDARMTAQVYETFLELDDNKDYLNTQKETHGDNPFANLSSLFD